MIERLIAAPEQARLIDDILSREGWPAFTDHAADDGGPTKGGITIRALEASRGRLCTGEELRALSEREARQIYRERYIEAPRFDRIADPALRALVIDSGVLFGPPRAARWLQAAINAELAALPASIGHDSDRHASPPDGAWPIAEDGRLGPATLEALKRCDPRRLGVRVSAMRIRRLGRRIADDPANARFAAGWADRAAELLLLSALQTPTNRGEP